MRGPRVGGGQDTRFLPRRWLLVCVAALLLTTGCGEFLPDQRHYYLHHTVRTGETLYSIAWRFGYDYRELAAWNRIAAPYTIYPGQELLILAPDRYRLTEGTASQSHEVATVPESSGTGTAQSPPSRTNTSPKPPAKPASSGTSRKPPAGTAPSRPTVKPAPRPNEPAQAMAVTTIKWQWPTQGKIVARFSAAEGRKGLDVSGKIGQPVHAAAGGEVVYSGNGLIGYGNLVIIKHDDVFLSAYAHNRRLLVKEGQRVSRGAAIAEMGQTPKGVTLLHFEVRRNGKPVDPLLYLPNQSTKTGDELCPRVA